jgi:hypothetical protein
LDEFDEGCEGSLLDLRDNLFMRPARLEEWYPAERALYRYFIGNVGWTGLNPVAQDGDVLALDVA